MTYWYQYFFFNLAELVANMLLFASNDEALNILLDHWIMERKQSSGFRRIFTVAFLLFLAPAGSLVMRGIFYNPVRQSLTFT